MAPPLSKRWFEVRHRATTQAKPIGEEGGVTRAETRPEIIGYLGLNHEKGVTKVMVLRFIGHPIIIKGFLKLTTLIDGVVSKRKTIGRSAFFQMIPHLRDTDEIDDGEEDALEADDTEESQSEGDQHNNEEHIELIAEALREWSEELKQLPAYDDDHINQDSITGIYSELDSLKPNSLPTHFRNIAQGNWPVGLQHERLRGHGETRLELFNRLWQLFWFLRTEVFQASKNRLWLEKAKNKPPVYTTNTPHAHLPLWWTPAGGRRAAGVGTGNPATVA